LLDFLWLALRCIAFIWAVSACLILVIFAVGTEAEGYSWGERIIIAIKYAGYVGGLFGSLLAITLSLKSWRIARANKKKLARREKAKQP
jgi:type VI protein secretion system component VasK